VCLTTLTHKEREIVYMCWNAFCFQDKVVRHIIWSKVVTTSS
jgi:hypothetical protein